MLRVHAARATFGGYSVVSGCIPLFVRAPCILLTRAPPSSRLARTACLHTSCLHPSRLPLAHAHPAPSAHQTVSRRMSAAQLMAVAPSQLLPGLFAAFQHRRPDVRKAVVFCLVEMWLAAGETCVAARVLGGRGQGGGRVPLPRAPTLGLHDGAALTQPHGPGFLHVVLKNPHARSSLCAVPASPLFLLPLQADTLPGWAVNLPAQAADGVLQPRAAGRQRRHTAQRQWQHARSVMLVVAGGQHRSKMRRVVAL